MTEPQAEPGLDRRSGTERRWASQPAGGPELAPERRSIVRRAVDRLTEGRARSGAIRASVGGRLGSLEAPHRRLEPGSRVLERSAVAGYQAASWLLQHLPARPAWIVGGWLAQLAYRLWPKKRTWIDANFGHVLGLPADDVAVRKLALAAYRNYARYLVDLMRLPALPPEKVSLLVEPGGLELMARVRRESKGLILIAAHIGNNEAVAAGIASLGLPISVVADDSAFPEMFALLRRQREVWGIKLIPWRKLRDIYGVLRRQEMLALLVDWGYRSDGIPVRLLDAWTCLPAGPAVLAAKTGATILPIVVRRHPDGPMHVGADDPIVVTSTDPLEVGRATQAVAAALERIVAAAPDQWYSFKPIWPATAEESAALAERPDAAGAHSFLNATGASGRTALPPSGRATASSGEPAAAPS